MTLARWIGVVWLLTVTPGLSQTQNRKLVEDIGIDQHLNAQVPLDLEFTDDTGRRVVLGDCFHAKPVILACVYYRCPMLCTQVLNGVLKATNAMNLQMDRDYTVIAVSIDPRETVEMASAKKDVYARRYRRPGAREGWHFLVGQQASIDRLTKVAGFRYRYDPESDQYLHASGILVLTPEGRISRYHYGIDFPPRDLRLSLVESSQNRIGNRVDQFLLLCFHYDQKTGRYGLVIANVLRFMGSITLAVMATYLGRMYMLERRRSAQITAQVVRSAAGPLRSGVAPRLRTESRSDSATMFAKKTTNRSITN